MATTTNISVNNVAVVELASQNTSRRYVMIYNPGTIALDLFLGTSVVAFNRLFQYGTCQITPQNGDPTQAIGGQLVSAGPQNIAVTK